MKVLVFIGNSPHHKFLAQLIGLEFEITSIIIDNKRKRRKKSKVVKKLFSFYIDFTWRSLMKFFNKKLLTANENLISYVDNINDFELKSLPIIEFDVVVVSGTSLLKKKLIDSLSPKKILNLHTGLSPYVNGGPNCTNWCITNNRFDLIGNTVMFLDEGIDSGNIISSKKLDLNKRNLSYKKIQLNVIQEGHFMYLEVLREFNNAFKNNEILKAVPQEEISNSKTYFTKDWGTKQILKLYKNLILNHNKKIIKKVKSIFTNTK